MEVESNMPEGWIETTLGETIYFVSDKINTEELTIYNYISTENLLSDNQGIVASSNLPTVSKVNSFKKEDVLFSNIRTYFKKVWFASKDGGSSNDVLIFRPVNEDSLNKHFLYRIISSDVFIDYTVKTAKGTKMPRGDKNAIKLFPINLPPLQEQKAIAKILTSFDDKIELLQEQNKTLETMAQTIFKEWFGKYQIGDELPDGWRVGKLDEVLSICGGTTPSTKNPDFWGGKINWTSPKDLSNSKGLFLLNTEKKITKEGLNKISSGLLPKGTLLLSSRAPVGYLSITHIELAINQGYIALLPQQYLSNNYMYLWLDKYMQVVKNAANGSTFLEISKTAFRNIECVVPLQDVLEKFDQIIEPIFSKVLYNITQTQSLTKTRDILLPKLMSGQVRVNNIKQLASA